MPFDGRTHHVGNLIPPYPHLPNAPALGAENLGTALRIAYGVARKGRSIGIQPYAPSLRATLADPITVGEWTGVARFMAVERPEWVTHVLAELHYHLDPSETAEVRYRLTATDGTDTDQISVVESVSPPGEDEPQEPRRIGQPILLPLAAVGAGALDVTLDAHASSPSASTFHGFEFRAELAAAWWVTLG